MRKTVRTNSPKTKPAVGERNYDQAAISRLAAIVESSDDAIIGKTLEGVITSWNRAAENIYGYTASEMLGANVSTLIPPARARELDIILEKIRRGEAIDHFETERVRKDGQSINVSLSVSPIKDSHGTIVGASTIARDITARKRAEAVEKELDQRIRDILESISDGFMAMNREW